MLQVPDEFVIGGDELAGFSLGQGDIETVVNPHAFRRRDRYSPVNKWKVRRSPGYTSCPVTGLADEINGSIDYAVLLENLLTNPQRALMDAVRDLRIEARSREDMVENCFVVRGHVGGDRAGLG
jgi:hypothetical protein